MLGRCQRSLRDLAGSRRSLDRAIDLAQDEPEGWLERARTHLQLGEMRAALADAMRATQRGPAHAAAWSTLGRVLSKIKHYPDARRAYSRALALDPAMPFLKGRLLQQQIIACDWTGLAEAISDIEADVAAGTPSARPFVWQAVCESPASLRRCATLYAHPALPPVVSPARPRRSDKIRIGYLSGELRDHSISYLRAGMLEHHDKSRFDIVAFDNGWDDGGAVRARINRAIDRIVPIRHLSDEAAAAVIADAGIDVLVDLNGFNGANRIGIMARRPAHVQTTLPGYPGTMGASYIDYMVCDARVIPPDQRKHYREAIALMPHSYQPNDSKRVIADRVFSRAELSLPEAGFVFCCFNNTYKIMPALFDAWTRILQAVPGSILWLLNDNPHACANLQKEAAHRGIDPARLVFAPRIPQAEHLARHRAADLFLDTSPCNAHATASDALWAGLPLLTSPGSTFSSRVATSLLHAVGLPELVAPTLSAYEDMAIALAKDPARLEEFAQRLAANRLAAPLFDTRLYTRHLETAFTIMHQRKTAGLPPETFAVPAETWP